MKAGWKNKSLGEILLKTETVNPAATPEYEFEYIDVSSVSNETYEIEETQQLKGKDAPSRARRVVKAGDVIFATIRPTLQRIARVPASLDGQVCSTGYFVMRPCPELDAQYLFYSLFTEQFTSGMESLQKGASYPAVTDAEVRSQQISYPSLQEQRRIVTLLDEAFADIATAKANAEKNLQNARELFDSALNAIQGKKEQLGEYVTIKTGKLDANAAVVDGEYPFFTCSREIFAIDTFAFDCEAILLAGNNAVGDFNVKHYCGKFNAYQRTYVITIQDEEILRYRYLYFQMLKSLKKFKEQSVGSSTKFLKLGMIKELEITLPPVQEQDRQLKLLSGLLEQIEDLESIYRQKLIALNDLKKSLLHQAFSGQLTQ